MIGRRKLNLENVIAICVGEKKFKTRNLAGVTSLVIHRCGVGEDAASCAPKYADGTKYAAGYYTNQKFPYHFLIKRDGGIQQCLPLKYNAPAALVKLNREGVHIACIGDMRTAPLTAAQSTSLLQLCEQLQEPFNWELHVWGHTEHAGNSNDPNKECPGSHLNLRELRASLQKAQVHYLSPEHRLSEHGFVL